MNDFTDVVSKVMEVRPDEGDYTGEDGLLYCGKCHICLTGKPKQRTNRHLGQPMKRSCFCMKQRSGRLMPRV